MRAWYRYDPGRQCLALTLHVQPNARTSAFSGLHGDALKVRIAAPAADNKANAELVRLIGDALKVPKASVAIRHGATGRRKVVEVSGGPELAGRLARLPGLTATIAAPKK